MSKYEVMFIVQPNTDESVIKDTINKLKEIYTSRGMKITDEVDMGMKELAYEIEKNKTGYYYVMTVESDHEANQEFERISRIDENVIRFMIINIDHVEENTLDIVR